MAKEEQVNTQQETNPKELFLQAEKHFQNLDFISMTPDERAVMIGDYLKSSPTSLYFLEQVEEFYTENDTEIDTTFEDRCTFYQNLILDQKASAQLRVFALRLILKYYKFIDKLEFLQLSDSVDLAMLKVICGSVDELDKFTAVGFIRFSLQVKLQSLIVQALTQPDINPLIVMLGTSFLLKYVITDRQPYLDFLNNLTDDQVVATLNFYPRASNFFWSFLDDLSKIKFLNRDIYTASSEALIYLVKAIKLNVINESQLLDLFFSNFFDTYQNKFTAPVETIDSTAPAKAPEQAQKLLTLLLSWRHLNSEMDFYNPALEIFSAKILEFLGLPYQQALKLIERFKQAQPTEKDDKKIPQPKVELEACLTNVSQALEFVIAWQNLAKEKKLPDINKSPLQLLMESGICIFARHKVETMINNIFATHGENLDPRALVDRKALIFYTAEEDDNGALSELYHSYDFFVDVNTFSGSTVDAIVVDGPIANLLTVMGRQRRKRNGLRRHEERQAWLKGLIWNEHGLETSMGEMNEKTLQEYKNNPNRDFTPDAVVLLDACLVGAENIDIKTGRFIPSLSDLLAKTLGRKVYGPTKDTGSARGYKIRNAKPQRYNEDIKIIPDYFDKFGHPVRARTSFPNPKTTS